MAMFITFYSYKGGVGRTLALANVATLLARDQDEPCRVLVWDFDLPAPGLQEVVKCKWRGKKLGFVDYLDLYLRGAQVDDIKKYIHPTSIPGVEILPAGLMGRKYARRLEEIKWREVYERARGFQFIANAKMQISQIQPAYDYVLIDSLTGYSDVGGICVNQLADVVVLMFRLNRQNIEGISKVHRSIRAYARKVAPSQPENVVPVISPAWPFAAPESNEWFLRVKKVFGNHRIFTLSFEGSMMLGEKILSAADEKYAIEPPILRDYRTLSRELRRLNSEDLKTTLRDARRLREQIQYSEAVDACGRLVERRPETERYWRELLVTVQVAPSADRTKILPKVNEIIRRGCEAQKPFAYIAKARLVDTTGGDWEDALRDLGKAIELDSGNADLHFIRGTARSSHKDFRGAAQDLSRALELNLQSAKLALAYFALGNCYRELGEPDKAVPCFSEAIKRQPNDATFVFWRAMALYSVGQYADAIVDVETLLKLSPSSDGVKILGAHLACSEGRTDEARRLLQAVRSRGELGTATLLNVAEAYLVFDPAETLRVLETNQDASKEYRVVASFLRAFAAELLGPKELRESSLRAFEQATSDSESVEWALVELKQFLEWGKARGQLTEEQYVALSSLIRSSSWS